MNNRKTNTFISKSSFLEKRSKKSGRATSHDTKINVVFPPPRFLATSSQLRCSTTLHSRIFSKCSGDLTAIIRNSKNIFLEVR